MRRFGLIGYPLSHSFSKKYFTDKFDREQILDCAYDLYPIQTIGALPALILTRQFDGLNVTIPYKRQVIAFLDETTAAVREMEACNCIHLVNGKLYGYNTDVVGFEKTFVPHLLPHHKRALILGTGGAASAVEFTMRKLGIEYLLVSRNKAGTNCCTYADLNKTILTDYTIIINTTPLGTSPDVNSCPAIPYRFITAQHYLYDLVYNPPFTLFLKNGSDKGATTQNGAEMLVIQAEESWKIWNDRSRF